MEIRFRTSRLRKQYEHHVEAEKAYGVQVARRYVERVNSVKHARDIEELKRLPGLRCHELTGDRRGEWAVNLTGFHRLIFTLAGELLEAVCI